MQRSLLFSFILNLLCAVATGQSPQRFNYQAIIRNTSGAIVASQQIGIRFSIRDLTTNGTSLYRETQQATSNTFGLINLQVGAGTVAGGNMNNINWGTGKKFLQIEVDLNGGANYAELATVELVAVPYAMHSDKSGSFTGPLAGDITGTQNATQIANGSVTTTKIAANGVDNTKIALKTITADRVASAELVKSINGLKDEVLLSGSGNVTINNTGNKIIIDVPNGGDITGVFAGNGLLGGASNGQAILSADFSNNGISNTVSRGDHTHIGQTWTYNTANGLVLNSTGAGNGIVSYAASTLYSASAVAGVITNGGAEGTAIYGATNSANGNSVGVYGQATGTGDAKAILGAATGNNWAGYFSGKVGVAGTLSKSAGSFKIDHPLDPANKYLYHSFVESPDMMNIYNGNVVLDGNGEAYVQMPDWFEALNMEFRYQLTAMGRPSPNVYIRQEINGNRFSIAGGTPGGKISWQVTGIRHDTYANENRIKVEELKPASERGTTISGKSKKVATPALRTINIEQP